MTKKKNILLDVQNLRTCFHTDSGVVYAVDDITFQVKNGEVLAIVGESGSGKSVTSLSIMRLIEYPGQIEQGKINFADCDLVAASEGDMRKIRGNDISMIFQEPLTSLNPLFTIGNQMREPLAIHQKIPKKDQKERVIQLLESVEIPHPEKVYRSYPHALSGGMRQRVMIAMALSCNPQLLIADEPTTALDVTIQDQILTLMDNLNKEKHTSILLITHDLGVVGEIADRVIVMYAGKIVEEADVYTLFEEPKHPYTQGLLESMIKIDDDREELAYIPGTVPSPEEMPQGCRFYDRCPLAMDRCRHEPPPMKSLDKSNKVRCWLYE